MSSSFLRMTEVYYDNPRRGYGKSISAVFYRLKNSQYINPFGPARQQFDGQGSCGNGSAMRISPAALLGFKDDKVLFEVSTRLFLHKAHTIGVVIACLSLPRVLQKKKMPPNFVGLVVHQSVRASS